MWFIGVEVEQETSAPPPKKNPGSAPEPTFQNLSEQQNCCPHFEFFTEDWTRVYDVADFKISGFSHQTRRIPKNLLFRAVSVCGCTVFVCTRPIRTKKYAVTKIPGFLQTGP